MKAVKLREKSRENLDKYLLELLREKFNLRMQRGSGQLSKTSEIGRVRRDIARIKTILAERISGDS